MRRLNSELALFASQPRDMRLLIITNLVYAFVLPVVEIFVGAYIMRNSQDVRTVMTYQLTVYAAIPFTFLLNGFLLKHVPIKRLYSLGMLLSGVSMAVMMMMPALDAVAVGIAGTVMGASFGLYWANRDFLALSTTNDGNRNYYYGLEAFLYTLVALGTPAAVGWFIAGAGKLPWLGSNGAYRAVTAAVFVLTIAASAVVHRGDYRNPPLSPFVFFRFHPLWRRLQLIAALRGLAQGYILVAPAMLVMRLLGSEAALGTSMSIGAIISAVLLYLIGRCSAPRHRLTVFGCGVILFALGGLFNAALFNAAGVLLFMLCLLLARPLLDVAYFPIQLRVIDLVAAIERRNEYAYILNQEFALFVGRCCGCVLFLLLAYRISDTVALRYAVLIIGGLQFLAVWAGHKVVRDCDRMDPAPPTSSAGAARLAGASVAPPVAETF